MRSTYSILLGVLLFCLSIISCASSKDKPQVQRKQTTEIIIKRTILDPKEDPQAKKILEKSDVNRAEHEETKEEIVEVGDEIVKVKKEYNRK